MNHLVALLIVTVFSAPLAQAAVDFDGCYQMYRPGVMYPALCLDGTKEEGIGGAGARIVIFGTNTENIVACGLSSALSGSGDSLEFIQNGKPELILKNVMVEDGVLEGDAVLGGFEVKFLKINKTKAKRLLGKFHQDKRCQGMAIGELRYLL